MTYGAEAIIPLEIGFPMLRTSFFTPSSNDGLLEKGLDLIEERRESVMVYWPTINTSSSRDMMPMESRGGSTLFSRGSNEPLTSIYIYIYKFFC